MLHIRQCILLILVLSIVNSINAQYDSRNFTYDESNKNFVNYEHLEELTTKFLYKNKSYCSQQYGYVDESLLPKYNNEEIHNKLLAIPTTIPLEYKPEVGKIIDYFLFNKRDYTTNMLTAAQTYFPIFEEVFDRHGLPMELKYLAIIESALNPKARSRVGATGLWQFMYSTAKHEGMKINSLEDERSDVYESTEHAAIFLKKLHKIYGDWLLALAAYNSGPGNVNKAIKRSGGYDFWSIKHKLPRETQNYVPSFIAICYAMHYADEYQLYPGNPKLNFQTCKTERFYDKQSLKYVSELSMCSLEDLEDYNPGLKKGIIPKKDEGYKLLMPKKYAENLNAQKHLLSLDPYIYKPSYRDPAPEKMVHYATTSNNSYSNTTTHAVKRSPKSFASIPAGETQANIQSSNSSNYEVIKVVKYQKKTTYHKVRRGENLTLIAKKHKVRLGNLKKWNELSLKKKLYVGKQLKIIKNEKVVIPEYVLKKSPEPSIINTQDADQITDNVVVHKIKRGETLMALTRLYGCTVDELKEWNQLSSNNVKVDQDIFVYIEKQAPKIKSYSYYEAKPGDTLITASIQFNVPLDVLKSLNNKENANEPLKKGEKIKIPAL